MTAQDAIQHIQALYPPDSQYDDTRAIGRDLMDNTVGGKVGYNKWRELSDTDLLALAKANLAEHDDPIFHKIATGAEEWKAKVRSQYNQ
jgi:hypothetical protein